MFSPSRPLEKGRVQYGSPALLPSEKTQEESEGKDRKSVMDRTQVCLYWKRV